LTGPGATRHEIIGTVKCAQAVKTGAARHHYTNNWVAQISGATADGRKAQWCMTLWRRTLHGLSSCTAPFAGMVGLSVSTSGNAAFDRAAEQKKGCLFFGPRPSVFSPAQRGCAATARAQRDVFATMYGLTIQTSSNGARYAGAVA
jgi:hypothetical protein